MAWLRIASLAVALMVGSAPAVLAQMVVGPTAPGGGGFPGQGPGTFPGQTFPGPGQGAPGGAMPGAFPGQAPQQAPPCMAEFVPLRTETEKRGAAIKAAAAKHEPAQKLCELFTRFIESENKVVKFMEKNAAACGIPAQIITSTKTNHARAVETKEKICAASANGPAEPRRGPGLGEALGVRPIPAPESTTTGAGTLDSLSGNPLAR
jgi:hypothetical protein